MIFGEDEYNIVAMAKNKRNNIEHGVVIYDCDDGEFITISLPKNATIKDNITQVENEELLAEYRTKRDIMSDIIDDLRKVLY